MKKVILPLVLGILVFPTSMFAVAADTVTKEQVANIISTADKDGDGKVSLDEYVASGQDKESFTAMDTNQDGFIDHEDVKE